MKYFLLFIFFCSFSFGHKPGDCYLLLDSVTKRGEQVKLVHQKSKRTFFVYDPEDPRFHLTCSLQEDGTLVLSVRKTSDDKTERADWSASAAFKMAIVHFGDRVKKIKGIWGNGSDNFRIYHEEIANGRSEEEAAFATWTGQQAKKSGFTKIDFNKEEWDSGKKDIKIIFSKP